MAFLFVRIPHSIGSYGAMLFSAVQIQIYSKSYEFLKQELISVRLVKAVSAASPLGEAAARSSAPAKKILKSIYNLPIAIYSDTHYRH